MRRSLPVYIKLKRRKAMKRKAKLLLPEGGRFVIGFKPTPSLLRMK